MSLILILLRRYLIKPDYSHSALHPVGIYVYQRSRRFHVMWLQKKYSMHSARARWQRIYLEEC